MASSLQESVRNVSDQQTGEPSLRLVRSFQTRVRSVRVHPGAALSTTHAEGIPLILDNLRPAYFGMTSKAEGQHQLRIAVVWHPMMNGDKPLTSLYVRQC